MAARIEREHQVHHRFAWYPVVNNDGSLVTTGRVTDTSAAPVSLQNRFAQTAEVLLILPLQRVASRAHSKAKTFGFPHG